MPNTNIVVIAGHITRDVEVKQTANSTLCKFCVAINRKYKGKDGESQEETTFVDVVVWGKQADNCSEYLSKGSPVLIEGCLCQSNWEDKDGNKRSKIEVKARRVQFLGKKSEVSGESRPETVTSDDDIPF